MILFSIIIIIIIIILPPSINKIIFKKKTTLKGLSTFVDRWIDRRLSRETQTSPYQVCLRSYLYNNYEIFQSNDIWTTSFLKSGAQIITTGSYQLSIQLLEEELDLEKEDAKEYIKKSVKLAKEAILESKCGK